MRPERIFWDWFRSNLRALGLISRGDEPIIRTLRRQLDLIDPGLMWELGTLDDGTRDFVISADGIPEVAPTVRRLVDAAPVISGWQITKFRPRREPPSLSREGYELSANELWMGFTADPTGGPPYDVVILLPGLKDENYNGLGSVAMVMLDGWLGEEFVMEKLRNFVFQPYDSNRSPGFFPLTDAPSAFDLS